MNSNSGQICVLRKSRRFFIKASHARPSRGQRPFFRIKKNMGPTLNLKVGKQSALVILEGNALATIQKKAPAPLPLRKREEKGFKTPSSKATLETVKGEG